MLLDRLSPFGSLVPGADGRMDDALELPLPPLPESVSEARHALTSTCRSWSVPELTDAAVLVLSELVTNAVVHAGTPLLLLAEHNGAGLTLAVADGSVAAPAVLPEDDDREDGRGMAIIEAMAAGWGFQRTVLGKVVWVTIGGTSS